MELPFALYSSLRPLWIFHPDRAEVATAIMLNITIIIMRVLLNSLDILLFPEYTPVFYRHIAAVFNRVEIDSI